MSIYTDKERVITDDQRSCQFVDSAYIDITLLIILAVLSSAVFWSISVFIVSPSFQSCFAIGLLPKPKP